MQWEQRFSSGFCMHIYARGGQKIIFNILDKKGEIFGVDILKN